MIVDSKIMRVSKNGLKMMITTKEDSLGIHVNIQTLDFHWVFTEIYQCSEKQAIEKAWREYNYSLFHPIDK